MDFSNTDLHYQNARNAYLPTSLFFCPSQSNFLDYQVMDLYDLVMESHGKVVEFYCAPGAG